MLYLISGYSATGKSYIVNKICKDFNKEETLSRTERKPRYKGEETHKFITKEEADKYYNSEETVAKTVIEGNRYFAFKSDIKDFYILDKKGILDLKKDLIGIRYTQLCLKMTCV